MPTALERMHLKYCPAGKNCRVAGGDGGEECDSFATALEEATDERVHVAAKGLVAQARRIEDEYQDRNGEVYKLYLYGAKKLRYAANSIDPYDNIPGTDILVRKSDGKPVRR
jgi:hypothetical protein